MSFLNYDSDHDAKQCSTPGCTAEHLPPNAKRLQRPGPEARFRIYVSDRLRAPDQLPHGALLVRADGLLDLRTNGHNGDSGHNGHQGEASVPSDPARRSE